MSVFDAHRAAPGGYRRWPRQAIELIRRRPLHFVAAAGLLAATDFQTILDQFWFFEVMAICAIVLALARAADLSEDTASALRAGMRPAVEYILVMVGFVILAGLMMVAAMALAGLLMPVHSASGPDQIQGLLDSIKKIGPPTAESIERDNLAAFAAVTVGFGPVMLGLYPAMLIGFRLGALSPFYASLAKAWVLNLEPMAAMFILAPTAMMLAQIPLSWLPALTVVLSAPMRIFWCVMLYLFAREVFEGRGLNEPVRARVPARLAAQTA